MQAADGGSTARGRVVLGTVYRIGRDDSLLANRPAAAEGTLYTVPGLVFRGQYTEHQVATCGCGNRLG